MSRSPFPTGPIVAASLVLAAACGSDDSSSASTTSPAPTETATVAPASTQAPTTSQAAPATTQPPETTQPEAPTSTAPPTPTTEPSAECMTIENDFSPLMPGDYCIETVGAPFTISIPTGWWVGPNSPGHLVLMDERSQGPGDQIIAMARATNIADPDNPAAPPAEQRGDWPLDDIEGWLATVIPGVLDGEPEATTLGGHDAVSFDVALTDEVQCLTDPCVGFSTNNGSGGTGFKRRIGYRVWWIDGGAQAPFIVMAADGGLPDFMDRAEAMLDTMMIDSIGRNPLSTDGLPWEEGISSEVPAGNVQLPLGPGVTFETTSDYFIVQPDHLLGLYAGVVGDDTWVIDMYFPSVDGDGAPVETVEDVVAGLELFEGAETEVVATRTVGSREATEVGFTSTGHGPGDLPVFPLADDPESGWTIPPEGTMWIVELDDDIMFIVANGYGPGELDTTTQAAQEILDSIAFGGD